MRTGPAETVDDHGLKMPHCTLDGPTEWAGKNASTTLELAPRRSTTKTTRSSRPLGLLLLSLSTTNRLNLTNYINHLLELSTQYSLSLSLESSE